MGMLLGGQKTAKTPAANTQVLNGVRVNSAVAGVVLPVIIGPARIPMNIIGLWDFLATAHTTPGEHVGKGIGGGGSTPSTTSYTYSTAMQAALGFGPIDHVDALWTSAG